MKTNPNDTIDSVIVGNNLLQSGLTKREYFAALAMQGMLSSGTGTLGLATRAVNEADALIYELNKRGKE